jgi:hypothetical protein
MTTASRTVTTIRIFCPVQAATLAAAIAGDAAAMDADPVLGAMLAILRDDGPLGDFGIYRNVVEIAPGWESFRPTDDANPTSGTAGAVALSPTIVLTTYIAADAPAEAVDGALARIMAAHPWEVPVVEIGSARLLVRG